jgi:hypothetical protein
MVSILKSLTTTLFLYTMLLFYPDGRTTCRPTERDAVAPCGSILVYRQTTMTQEFRKPPEPEILLPPGWIQLPDNSPGGGRPYYFNTVDHNIQVDIAKVYERVVMSADANAAVDENACTCTHEFAVPDGVVSSSHNTISPSPGGRNSGRNFGRKKSPPGYIAPAPFGG